VFDRNYCNLTRRKTVGKICRWGINLCLLTRPLTNSAIEHRLHYVVVRTMSLSVTVHFTRLLALLRFHRVLRHKPLPDSLHHLAEPVEVEYTQCRVSNEINADQPHGQIGDLAADRPAIWLTACVAAAHVIVQQRAHETGRWGRQCLVDVRVDQNRLVGAPHDPTEEKGEEESEAVV
jgi:hypothetical protein